MPKTIHVKAYVKMPNIPNFLIYEGCEGGGLDVADVSDESLKEIGKLWTEALLEHAAKRRKKVKEDYPNGKR